MFNKYYESELHKLREHATEFAKQNPVTAPLLMGPSMDPGAERMLEGVAFLSGLLNQKLDNEFQKFIKETIDLIYPQLIRPIPSTSIILFEPKQGQNESIFVKSETTLAANKIEETSCKFRTTFDIEVHPINLISTKLNKVSDNIANLEINLELTGISLDKWNPKDGLYFFLGGTYTRASYIYMLLYNHLKNIKLRSEDGSIHIISVNNLEQIGVDVDTKLLDFPAQSFSTFRLLQEYFVLPYKFFFSKLTGFDTWKNRGNGNNFTIIFELHNIPDELPQVNNDTFIFNTVPVINLFKYEMDPIRLDHTTEKILLRPNPLYATHYQVYDIENIYAYKDGSSEKKEYFPIASIIGQKHNHNSIYQLIRERSIVNNYMEAYLFFPYQDIIENLSVETLVTTIKATNGRLPEKLRIGDICKHTFESPETLNFRNILQPTHSIEPPSDSINLWRFISYLSMNFLSLAELNNLKTILRIFLPAEDLDKPRLIANQKRVDGISSIKISPYDKIYKGRVMRGQNVEVEVNVDNFAGIGDVYLFGTVMNSFFSSYASINTFTQFTLKEIKSGAIFKWAAKIGNRVLL